MGTKKSFKSGRPPKLSFDPSEADFQKYDSKPTIKFEPRNEKQAYGWNLIEEKPISMIIGSVGSGKTKLACMKALELLINNPKLYKRIVFLRPTCISDTEQLGYLKGDMDEKIAPLILPMKAIYEDDEVLGKMGYENMVKNGKIQPYSLGHVEGLTYKKTIVLLDEFQNTTPDVLKMIMTRVDDSSKLIIMGDKNQIKLPNKQDSAAYDINRFRKSKMVGFCEFNKNEIVRGKITKEIYSCYPEADEEDENDYDFSVSRV